MKTKSVGSVRVICPLRSVHDCPQWLSECCPECPLLLSYLLAVEQIVAVSEFDVPLSFKVVAICRSVVVSNDFLFDQSAIAGTIVRPDVSLIGSSAARYDAP